MSNKREVINEVIFNDNFNEFFDESVTPVLLETGTTVDVEAPTKQDQINDWLPEKSEGTSCSYCRVSFSNVHQQREHYRLDWHRYNLRQSLQSKVPITEEDFNSKTENDDLSSISGSDTEEDEQDTLDTLASAQGKIFLQNQKGQVCSMYRGILLVDKKEDPASVNFYKRYRQTCQENKQWAILMLGGGHFAGAIFNYLTPVLHKTFHCYTVRAGQGGSQSSRDNKGGGSHPKSAGASLRRYNEQALIDHVQNILTTWREELKKSSLIFYRASGPYNRGVIFGGKDPLLDRSDSRLRTIPFSTGRATYTEVKRVHLELCSVPVYGTLSDAANQISKQRSPERDSKRNKARSNCINRAKSREVVERPLPGELSHSNSKENVIKIEKPDDEEDTNSDEAIVIGSEDLELSFKDLEECGDSLTPEQRKKGQRKKNPRKSKTQKLREKEEARKKNLVDILVKGNPLLLEELLQERLKIFEEGTNVSRKEIAQDFFNEVLDEAGNSFLHLGAMNEHEEMLQYLLDKGADPCLKNKNQQTPYSCTSSKISRDVLRKFAKENPDKYNYNKAQIPVNVVPDEELAEKKRAQRKVKREKEKEKKKENFLKQKEEEQKDRFLKLSDREKRALAAEKRILNAQGKIVARCFLCASDMAGKVPFEYMEYRFCSIDCLKSHRMKTSMNL